MKLAEQIEIYKSKNPNKEHTFKNGVKCPKLHDWLDKQYKDCIQEYKLYGTDNWAQYVKEMLN